MKERTLLCADIVGLKDALMWLGRNAGILLKLVVGII